MQRLVRWRIKKRKARRASLSHRWLSQAHLKIAPAPVTALADPALAADPGWSGDTPEQAK